MRQFKLVYKIVFLVSLFINVSSCNGIKSGDNLSTSEIEYIRRLGLLDNDEKIILFETHSGKVFSSYKTSGNFISDKRLAAYWIDEDDQSKTKVDFAYYKDIDTLKSSDLSNVWPSASYLSIKKKNGKEFKLYISGSSSDVNNFFNQAMLEWEKNKY